MNTKHLKLFFLLALIVAFGLHGQDTITLKNGTEINGWIVEKTKKELKYRVSDDPDSPLIILKSRYIDHITLSNGQDLNVPKLNISHNKRLGINAGLVYGLFMESAFYKLQADYFVTPEINLELNGSLGIEGGIAYSIGAIHYFNPYKPQKIKSYSGFRAGSMYNSFYLQVPYGWDYTSKAGFDVKFDIAATYVPKWSATGVYLQLLLGWRF